MRDALLDRRGLAMVQARPGCGLCAGFGRMGVRGAPCTCAYRGIFTECLEKFRALVESRDGIGRDCFLELSRAGPVMASLKQVEFMVDFETVAKRPLSALRRQILELHFLQGMEWRPCSARLRMDRGNFWHEAYKVMEESGKALANAGVWPLDEYFGARRVQSLSTGNSRYAGLAAAA